MDNNSYNLSHLINMIGDDQDSIKEFVALFIETSTVTLSELNEAFEQKNYSLMGSLAHKLKSSIDLMGIDSLKSEIRKIERIGKEMYGFEDLPELVKKLNEVLKTVHQAMNNDILS